jgi:type I restriction enzyme M protein
MPPMNERKTEDLVELRLRKRGYLRNNSEITIEKQKSDTPRIQKLLETASKRGGGVGKPEFLIHAPSCPEFLIVVECKADHRKHESATLDRYADYAVDGALLYASYLSKDYDVLAIGVSGQDEATYRISHYLHLKGATKAIPFEEARDVVPIDEYYEAFLNSDAKFRQDYEALLDFSRSLNNQLQARKVTEAERAFLISGILIALKNKAFKGSYKSHKTGKQLANSLLGTIRDEFESAKLPEDRRGILDLAFAFIARSPTLTGDKEFFVKLIDDVDSNINAFRKTHEYYDIIGQFYIEFLRYANNDKGLGIVLTPPHVAELFSDLADVNKKSIVFDNCCGTSGLLIAAMSAMIRDAGADSRAQDRIKNRQLFGIEFQPKIYALAVSNMILHGDGKTNISRGDCFVDAARIAGPHKPTVGVLNPPYKNKTIAEDKEELEFVFNNLECLQQGGRCVAIIPITCATAPSGEIGEWKRKILQRHTLDAVMSMPIELFHNSKTNVVTCVMVFTAHQKHRAGKKTWFGYWRDDGFVKTKHLGRIDINGSWPSIKARWLSTYRSHEVIEGESVIHEVGASDEWCAEAYLDTDYEKINRDNLAQVAKRYVLKCAMLQHAIRSDL